MCAMYLFSLWLGISLSTGVTGVRMVLIRSSDNLSRAMKCWPLFRTAEISGNWLEDELGHLRLTEIADADIC